MKCEYCGSELAAGSEVCPFCYAELGEKDVQGDTNAVRPPVNAADAPDVQPQAGRAMPPDTRPQSQPRSHPQANPSTAQPAPAAQPAQAAPQKRKSRLPLILGIAAVAIVLIVGFGAIGSGGGGATSSNSTVETAVPEGAESAIQDASALAGEMAERYGTYLSSAEGTSESSNVGRPYDQAYKEITDSISRVQDDMSAIEKEGAGWEGYDQAHAAMGNLEEVLDYELAILEAQHNSAKQGTGVEASLKAVDSLYGEYSKIEAPTFLQGYISKSVDTMPTLFAALQYNAQAKQSTLSQYTAEELFAWWSARQTTYDIEADKAIIAQLESSEKMLNDIVAGSVTAGSPTATVETIDQITPNLYPSLDSAVIVSATSYDDSHSVIVTAEIKGFSQKFEQKYDLAQGYNYLAVKPAILPTGEMTDLSSNSTTQIDVKVTDEETGAVVAQVSDSVELLSKYDFTWENDRYGSTASFDIMAWLRPQADEVNAVNRLAADYLGEWTNGQMKEIVGYQYGDDWSGTLLQVAAIQAAISEKGVVYIMDPYSFTSDQHVLTPDQVVQKQQGLCIETSLLMASCLLSANMHPLIIVTPGHAQIAVETYSGSGAYFLIETTTLPYDGVNTKYKYNEPGFWNGLLASAKTQSGETHVWTPSGSSDEWKEYLDYKSNGSDEFGGVFVIDCSLQPLMGIQGVENL